MPRCVRAVPLALALLLLALVGLFLWNPFQRREAVGPSTAPGQPPAVAGQPAPATGQPASAAGGPITDVPIGQPDKLVALVGKPVQLTNVRVQDVVGDQTFWVGPSETQHLFVVLEEDRTRAQKVEGQVDVNEGQRVTIRGEIRKLPSAEEARREWGISPQTFEALQKEPVYLHARSVNIVSGS